MKQLFKALALLVLAVALKAQTPDLPPMNLFNEWLAAFNSGNADTLRTFFERRYPERLRNLDSDLQFRERTGGFAIARIESLTAERLTCVVKERGSDQFARATVEVAAGAPQRMVSFRLRGIPTPPALTSPPASQNLQHDTPAEGQLRSWLEVFNRGTRDELSAFLRDRFPSRLPALDCDVAFRASTGGFTFVRVESPTPERVIALLQERISDQFARATMEVGTAAPYAITALAIRVTPRPADIPVTRLSESELATQLRSRLSQSAAPDMFSGAVLVVRRGTPIIDGAYGLADREKRQPNDSTTQFRPGSMDKMFTAVAILRLV